MRVATSPPGAVTGQGFLDRARSFQEDDARVATHPYACSNECSSYSGVELVEAARATNPWTLSFAVSVVYLGIFLHLSKADETAKNDLLFGFCVAGFPETPNRQGGCHHDLRNSHIASFIVNTAMGPIVYALHRHLKRRVGSESWNPKITAHFAFMATIVILHGFLHLGLSELINCYVTPDATPMWLLILGRIIFSLFSFLLCYGILAISFAQDGTDLWTKVILPSLLLSGMVVSQSLGSGVEWLLPALFSVSHPLSCVAALFSKSPIFTNLVGWAFLLATLMGILELASCQSLYRSLGGHLWYDIWLNVAVLLSLPPFAPPIASLVKKCASPTKQTN